MTLIAERNHYQLLEATNGAFCVVFDMITKKRYIFNTLGQAESLFIQFTDKEKGERNG